MFTDGLLAFLSKRWDSAVKRWPLLRRFFGQKEMDIHDERRVPSSPNDSGLGESLSDSAIYGGFSDDDEEITSPIYDLPDSGSFTLSELYGDFSASEDEPCPGCPSCAPPEVSHVRSTDDFGAVEMHVARQITV
uniref:ORF2 n=1 Tax=Steinernema glaseri TaxID=37863 RepID=A0A1I7ZF14_9BILA